MAGALRKVLYFLGILEDSDIEEGNPLDSLYFILEGEFSVTSGRSAGEIARLSAGEILGEMSFVDARPPSATVTALTNSTIGIVPRRELERKLSGDVGFAAR